MRRAISTLVSEGVLNVLHGRGTFARIQPERQAIVFTNDEHPDLLSDGFDLDASDWTRLDPPVFDAEPGKDYDERSLAWGKAMVVVTRPERAEAERLGIDRSASVVYRLQRWEHRRTGGRIEHLNDAGRLNRLVPDAQFSVSVTSRMPYGEQLGEQASAAKTKNKGRLRRGAQAPGWAIPSTDDPGKADGRRDGFSWAMMYRDHAEVNIGVTLRYRFHRRGDRLYRPL